MFCVGNGCCSAIAIDFESETRTVFKYGMMHGRGTSFFVMMSKRYELSDQNEA